MIAQLVLDDATLQQLLGDPRVWQIIPHIRNKHEEWDRNSEAAAKENCSSCQQSSISQKKANILNEVRSSIVSLPNAQRLQLKQMLSAKTVVVFVASGGKVTKFSI